MLSCKLQKMHKKCRTVLTRFTHLFSDINATAEAAGCALKQNLETKPDKEECSEKCPGICVSVHYKFNIHSLPTHFLNNSVTTVGISYKDSYEEHIEEQLAYSFSTCVSNVGGISGLFCGMSLMSHCEFLLVACCYLGELWFRFKIKIKRGAKRTALAQRTIETRQRVTTYL